MKHTRRDGVDRKDEYAARRERTAAERPDYVKASQLDAPSPQNVTRWVCCSPHCTSAPAVGLLFMFPS